MEYQINIVIVNERISSIVVSDGENSVSFGSDYFEYPISKLIDDFDKTIAYKDSL